MTGPFDSLGTRSGPGSRSRSPRQTARGASARARRAGGVGGLSAPCCAASVRGRQPAARRAPIVGAADRSGVGAAAAAADRRGRRRRAAADPGTACWSEHRPARGGAPRRWRRSRRPTCGRCWSVPRPPLGLIWGEQDRTVPIADRARDHRAPARRRLELIPGAGHVSMVERPEAFVRALERLLARRRARKRLKGRTESFSGPQHLPPRCLVSCSGAGTFHAMRADPTYCASLRLVGGRRLELRDHRPG